MHLYDRFVRIRMISANPEIILTKLTGEKIELENVVRVDDLTVEFSIPNTALSCLERIPRARCCPRGRWGWNSPPSP